MINEGFQILEDGIALRPGEIDVVWVAGFGFPKELGGRMYWAEQIGFSRIVERLEYYGRTCGNDYWTPSKLLGRAGTQEVALTGVPVQ